MSATIHTSHPAAEAFRHEAMLYAGREEFLHEAGSFIRDSLAAEEPILVVVSADKIADLTAELGGDAGDACFADMAEVGSNPARIIPAWRDFVTERSAPGRRVRGIGEPIGPGRGPAELAECHRHESLLNVAFADATGFWLLCPYDTERLRPDVIEEACRTHPLVVEDGAARASSHFHGVDAAAAPFDAPLPDPPEDAQALDVHIDTLAPLRRFVAHHAAGAQLSADRVRDLVLAVSEVAANSVRHGGGRGVLRLWREPDALVCDIRDSGLIDLPLVGRVRPNTGQIGGYGLWLANQVCDLVQIRSFPTGSTVRLHMRLG